MVSRIEGLAISRRKLLVGGGLGAGLLLAWELWPRRYAPNLRAAPGETLFNAFLKVGSDGRVIVAVPQAELGQGVYTSLPQILADELGADWRTISVEPAPVSPLYANRLLAQEAVEGELPAMFEGLAKWWASESATRSALMLTGGSTSIRAFEEPLRQAGAAARSLLCKAAARHWDADWENLDTRAGFVWNGKQRLSFGELADEAAAMKIPGDLEMRGGSEDRLTGEPLPRLDLPSKVDGSAQFAGDIRLPGLVYASVRQAPPGAGSLLGIDRSAAEKIPGLITIIENPSWVASVASNWWAANRATEALRPRFAVEGTEVNSAGIDRALAEALAEGDATSFVSRGDVETAPEGSTLLRADYAVGFAPNAALEPLTATARYADNHLEIWTATQAPAFARDAAARAAGIDPDDVTLYPTIAGGGYGRKLEMQAVEQAAELATRVGRPVQLSWSRIEETWHDSLRPPARASLAAHLGDRGSVLTWRARIATPPTSGEIARRLRGKPVRDVAAEAAAVAGAVPPYQIAAVAIDHVPVAIGHPTGAWRSMAHSYTCFFTECFIDELSRAAKIEPMSFRMQMLGDNPRLARTIATAAQLGGWDGGGNGSAMGLAAHSAFGSHVALVLEIEVDEQLRLRVLRAACAVDCGRTINPDIVRQQVEGGVVFGIGAATGTPIRIDRGLPTALGFRDLGLPLLSQSPETIVELIVSDEEPGGVTELAVPPVAPAIANALFALTGKRVRTLPLTLAGA